jgi:hypothetical protein
VDVNVWIGSDSDMRRNVLVEDPELTGLDQPSWMIGKVFRIANSVLPDDVKFAAHSQIDELNRGEPDYVIRKKQRNVAPIRIREKWNIGGDRDILGAINQENLFVIGALNEILLDMKTYKTRFGILTSYEYTWFLRRKIKDGREFIKISAGISYAQSRPTLIEALVYFASECAIESDREYSEDFAVLDSFSDLKHRFLPISPNLRAQLTRDGYDACFTLTRDFSLDVRLGLNRSCVYLESFQGIPIALKVSDVRRDEVRRLEMKHEVDAYMILESLQEQYIPGLVLYGQLQCVFYCIGLSVVGNSVQEELSDAQKDYLLEGLQKTHQLNILHGHVNLENIIIDEQGIPYWIGFSYAKFQPTEQQKEKKL